MMRLAMAGCGRLVIVFGAQEPKLCEYCVAPTNVEPDILVNLDWRKGLASSLRVGIEHAVALNSIGATVIALCDHPLIDKKSLWKTNVKSHPVRILCNRVRIS